MEKGGQDPVASAIQRQGQYSLHCGLSAFTLTSAATHRPEGTMAVEYLNLPPPPPKELLLLSIIDICGRAIPFVVSAG